MSEREVVKNYTIELRYDIQAPDDDTAKIEAARAASLLPGGRVTAVFDEEWEEV